MQSRTRSLRKSLALRLAALAVLLSATAGGIAFFLEKKDIEAGVADWSSIGARLLRARVRDLALSTHDSWQNVVQRAVEELSEILPRSTVGRFAWVQIKDADGRELANLADGSDPAINALIAQAAAETVFVDGQEATIRPQGDGWIKSAYAVVVPVSDDAGRRTAIIKSLFVVSPQTVAHYWQRIAWAVGGSMVIVVLVTSLHYPVISRLLDRLGLLSIHLLDANLETLQALGSAIAKRDSDTDAHNYRVTIYAVRLAEAMGLDAAIIRTLIKGAFLHDVGKIGVRDHILLKPGRLEPDEFEIMKTHVAHGLDIVNRSQWLRDAGEVVGHHHEKFDGSGYYQGLKGREIPVTARIFAIVDVFDALTSERPYKQALPFEDAMEILQRGAGPHFDPELLRLFEPIARTLYLAFGNREDDARNELGLILEHYFKGDIGALLRENER
ncbi:HD-GYP domain-containing protein [Methylococcus sp. EFPC2]|uniref:HD-GYP domain-containing protein n=1 Tax=Methylococcus sp. EFPC2 TaxID=2812648 RepID=UPI0019685A4F|nr:HD domain-containing phosphohydrolase [Methylococcus sp. EFPC2]QSA97830.1 HD domain-containing protein [Methylococcus sp. EFPC2]